jgi:hypothetical protein
VRVLHAASITDSLERSKHDSSHTWRATGVRPPTPWRKIEGRGFTLSLAERQVVSIAQQVFLRRAPGTEKLLVPLRLVGMTL